jgi:hypothetical protein
MLVGSRRVNIQVLGSDGGRKSGKGDELVLHVDCVVDAVEVEVEADDRLRKIMRRSTTTTAIERESWCEDR